MAQISAVFGADFSKFKAEVDAAQLKIKGFEDSSAKVGKMLETMTRGFSGVQVIQQATQMAEAIRLAGGVTTLTAKELEKAGKVAAEAAEKMHAMGVQVPPEFQAIADAAAAAKTSTTGWFDSIAVGVATGEILADMLRKIGDLAWSAAKAFPALVVETIRAGSALWDLHQATGATVEGLSTLQYLGGQTGIEMGTFNTAMFRLETQLGATGKAGKQVAADLGALGLSLDTLKREQPDQAMLDILRALSRLPDEATKARVGLDLFGKGFKDLRGLTRENVDGMIADAERLGLVMTTQMAAAADMAGDAWATFSAQLTAAGHQIAVGVLPSLITAVRLFSEGFNTALKTSGMSAAQFQETMEIVMGGVMTIMADVLVIGANVSDWIVQFFAGKFLQNVALIDWWARLGKTVTDVAIVMDLALNRGIGTAGLLKLRESFVALDQKMLDWTKNTVVLSHASETMATVIATAAGTMKDKWAAGLAAVKSEIADLGKKTETGFSGFREGAETAGTAAERLQQKALPLGEALVLVGKHLQAEVDPQFAKLSDLLDKVQNPLGTATIKTVSLGEALLTVGSRLRDVDPEFATLSDLLDRVQAKAGPAGLKIVDLGTALLSVGTHADVAKPKLDAWATTLDSLSQAFAQLAQSANGSDFGRVAQSIGVLFNALRTAEKAGESFANAWSTNITGPLQAGQSRFSQTAEGIAQMSASIVSAVGAMDAATSNSSTWQNIFGGAATGAQFGAQFGPYGAAVGAGIGALVGALRSSGTEAQQTAAAFTDLQHALNALLTTQEHLEAGNNTWAGSVLALRDMYVVLGVDATTAMTLAGEQMRDLAHAAAAGPAALAEMWTAVQARMEEASKREAAALTDMGKAGQDATRLISKETADMIETLTQAGLKTEEITAFFGKMGAAAIKGFNDMVGAIRQSLPTWIALGDRVTAAQAAIDKIRTSGLAAPVAPAPSSRAPASVVNIDDTRAAYAALGILLDDDTAKLLALQNTALAANAALKSAITTALGGLTNTMAALQNAGKMTSGTFATQQGVALGIYARLQAAIAEFGGSTKDALEPMQTYLREAREEAARLGVPLDATLSMLIAQSKEVGLWQNTERDTYEDLLATYQRAQQVYEQGGSNLEAATKARDAAAAAAKGQLETLGQAGLVAFAAATASGMSWMEAVKAISPGITELQQGYESLGIVTENTGVKALFTANTMLKNNPALMTGLQGLVGESTALANMNLLTAGTFADMEAVGAALYTQLQAGAVAAGGSTRDALMPMQDWLHRASEEADRYGFSLDANTQQMINQSKELGIWKDTGTTAAQTQTALFQGMLEVLLLIGETLGADIPDDLKNLATAATDSSGAFKAKMAPGVAAALTDRNGTSVSAQATIAQDNLDHAIAAGAEAARRSLEGQDWSSWNDPLLAAIDEVVRALDDLLRKQALATGGAGAIGATVPGASTGARVTASGLQYFASGGNVLRFVPRGTDTVPAMLTPGETVLTDADMKRLSGGSSMTVTIVIQDKSGKELAREVVPYIPGELARYGIGPRR